MDKLVYTVKEFAELLDIGMNKAYELISLNQVPFVRIGRKYIIPKTELESWLKQTVGSCI